MPVQRLGFEEQHRVVIVNGAQQQALGVIGIGGNHHFQARERGHHLVHALAVLARGAEAATAGEADHRRAARFAAEHVAELGHLVDDLVHAYADKIGEHDFRHRAQAHQGGARRGADNGRLGDGRVDAAIRPFPVDAAGDAEDAAHAAGLAGGAHGAGHVLADHKDRFVFRHGLMQGLIERIAHGFPGHARPPAQA